VEEDDSSSVAVLEDDAAEEVDECTVGFYATN